MSLTFFYGAMNSGKSTLLLQKAHSFKSRNLDVAIIAHESNSRDIGVASRLGVNAPADIIVNEKTIVIDVLENYYKIHNNLKIVLVDEAQFLTPSQVEDLLLFTVKNNVDIECFGLKTDFQTKSFPGSLRLLELSDVLQDLKLTRCRCGKEASFNARFSTKDHSLKQEGEVVAIESDHEEYYYDPVCPKCFIDLGGILRK